MSFAGKSITLDRKGTELETPQSLPILAAGIGTRISDAAEIVGPRKDAAAVIGVSPAALQRYVSEDNMPPFDAMARLCAASGVRMEWLAFAQGPKLVAQSAPETAPESHSQAVRHDVLMMALQLATEALEDKSKTLPNEKRAELVALIYEMLEEGLPEAKVLRFARAATG